MQKPPGIAKTFTKLQKIHNFGAKMSKMYLYN